ncbi:hypothetical protein F4679DRAFT_377497 [Xylaria curta]|nr:hypothetical protein F4679DRAFT_377497 [Xylaria curta]
MSPCMGFPIGLVFGTSFPVSTVADTRSNSQPHRSNSATRQRSSSTRETDEIVDVPSEEEETEREFESESDHDDEESPATRGIVVVRVLFAAYRFSSSTGMKLAIVYRFLGDGLVHDRSGLAIESATPFTSDFAVSSCLTLREQWRRWGNFSS